MRLTSPLLRRLAILLLLGASAPPLLAESRIELVNLDGAGEGLNDPAPVTPAGGNSATTRGEARLEALEFALSLWAQSLSSLVAIRVGVSFDPLGGNAQGAPLGSAAPEAMVRDFVGAPLAGTWYPSALADKLAGTDLDPESVDIVALFNSDVDGPTALGPTSFYYGFDANPPAGDVSFLHVVLHEIGHGLGFTTVLDPATGAKFFGHDDVFMRHLERHGASPAAFPSMSNAQRLAALTAGADVHWTGPAGIAAASLLTAGASPGGHIEMYAPTPLDAADALTHFSTTLQPNQILEPFYLSDAGLDLTLTLALLEDLGWGASPACVAGPSP